MTAAQRDEDELKTDESYLIKSNQKEKGSTYKEKVDEPIFFIYNSFDRVNDSTDINDSIAPRAIHNQINKQAMDVDERVRFFILFGVVFVFQGTRR